MGPKVWPVDFLVICDLSVIVSAFSSLAYCSFRRFPSLIFSNPATDFCQTISVPYLILIPSSVNQIVTIFPFLISVGRVRSPTRRLHQSWSRVFSHHMIFLSHNKYSVYVDIEDTKARNSFNFIICVERIDFTFISIRKVRAKSPRDPTPSTPDS